MRIGIRGWLTGALACAALAGMMGCRVDEHKSGDGKDVKIATPFGGMRVKTDQKVVPGEIGLAVYPGATPVKKESDDSGSADVNIGFGGFQLRVKAASYLTPDAPDKVEAFYRNEMKKYGDVITCRDHRAVGQPARTSDGLTCSDEDKHVKVVETDDLMSKGLDLKAGSRQHQPVVGIHKEGDGTKIGLVALDLPGKMFSDDSSEGDRQ